MDEAVRLAALGKCTPRLFVPKQTHLAASFGTDQVSRHVRCPAGDRNATAPNSFGERMLNAFTIARYGAEDMGRAAG